MATVKIFLSRSVSLLWLTINLLLGKGLVHALFKNIRLFPDFSLFIIIVEDTVFPTVREYGGGGRVLAAKDSSLGFEKLAGKDWLHFCCFCRAGHTRQLLRQCLKGNKLSPVTFALNLCVKTPCWLRRANIFRTVNLIGALLPGATLKNYLHAQLCKFVNVYSLWLEQKLSVLAL